MHEAKGALRRRVLAARDRLPAAHRIEAAAAAIAHLLACAQWQQAHAVAATLSIGSELPTDALVARARIAGKRIALPRIDAATRMLELFFVDDIAAQTKPGVWEIREPIPERCEPAQPSSIDLVIVPGVAFDRTGGRLGYGGGFYDRLLPTMHPEVPKLSLAYSMQLVDRVPRGPHDVMLDGIITEREVILLR